jgi:hypothetical protein
MSFEEIFGGVFVEHDSIAATGSIYEDFLLEAGIIHEARLYVIT